jgi:serine/threonine protein kinase
MPDIISCYELQGKLGTGGMGTVYRAKDTRSGQTVAVKLLHPHLASDPEYVRRFKREARIARELNSPNIVRVLDFGQDGDNQYIVMEYVEGQTLGQLIQKQGPLPIAQAVSIASQAAAALDEAHKHSVVHRDIKPQNIIIAPNGVVKVTDFGVARVTGETTMTQHGTFMGTAPYMAPDHIFGGVDTRSDIYSLGIVLYQMLTGAVPFNADTPWATLELHKSASLPPVNGLRADAPPWLVRITNRCLEKRPDRRFQSPGDLMVALQDGDRVGRTKSQETALLAADGQGRPPQRPTPAATPDPWGRRVPFILGGSGAFAAVFVVALLIFSTGGGGGGSGSTPTPVIEAPFDITSIRCVPDTPQIGVAVSCTGEVTGSASQLSWSASDGQPPSGSNPVLVTSFSSEGVKQVTLQACTSPVKCVSKTTQVTVAALVQGKISCQSLTVGVGQTLTCQTAATSGRQLSWHADGGKPPDGTGNQFTTEFDTPGTIQVQLKSCVGSNCTIQDTAQISVVQGPAIKSVTCQPSAMQAGQKVDCTADISGNVTTWSWFAPGGAPATGVNHAFSTSFTSEGSVSITVQACAGPTLCANGSSTVTVSLPCFNLHLNLGGGSGSIPSASSPNCGNRYKQGTVVSLTASASAGWRVDHWQGADSDAGLTSNSVTMNGDRSVSVYYQEIPNDTACYTLTLSVRAGSGAPPAASPGPNCPTDGGKYAEGTVVSLTANPAGGWRVATWQGADNGDSQGTTNLVTMSSDRTVQVNYELIPTPEPTPTPTPTPIPTPAAPYGLSVAANDPYSIAVTWIDNSGDEDGFEINDCCVSQYAEANAQYYIWTGLSPNTYKCFHVRARKGSETSDWTDYACTTTLSLTPSPTPTPSPPPTPTPTPKPAIRVDGNPTEWSNVPTFMTDPAGNSPYRFDGIELKIFNDSNYVYFLVQYAQNIPYSSSGPSGDVLWLDTDQSAATGCPGLPEGADFDITLYWDGHGPMINSVGDSRNCEFSSADNPGALIWAVNGPYFEAALPIQLILSRTPNFSGFNLVRWEGSEQPPKTYLRQ